MKLRINPEELTSYLLPVDGLSGNAQAILNAVAETYQCSRDIVLAAMFAATSIAVGKRVCIYDGKYYNYPCLWLCVVAPSGSNKSIPVRHILRPLIERDAASYQVYKSEIKEWRKAQDDNLEEPIFRQLMINDTTPEARNKALAVNGNGILLYRDEIKGALDDIGRYAKSGEVSQWLSIYDSDNITINRKSEDTLLIEHPFMGILGGIQPDVLSDAFGRDLLMNNGFNQRWLFVYPNGTPPPMYSDKSVPREITGAWNTYITQLLDFDFAANDLHTLYITDEAKQVYVDYYNSLQAKKADADSYMGAVYSKLQIQVQRWAGIAHLLGNQPGMSRILPEEMMFSTQCMNYFERCAEKVYSKLIEGKRSDSAKPMGTEEMIARLFFATNPPSIQAFADGIGVSRQHVSKCLKKYERLRSCGCVGTQVVDNVVDIEESGATSKNMVSE